jgi:hypothetical protein
MLKSAEHKATAMRKMKNTPNTTSDNPVGFLQMRLHSSSFFKRIQRNIRYCNFTTHSNNKAVKQAEAQSEILKERKESGIRGNIS